MHRSDVVRSGGKLFGLIALGGLAVFAGGCSIDAAPSNGRVGVGFGAHALSLAPEAGTDVLSVVADPGTDSGSEAGPEPIALRTGSGVVVGRSLGKVAAFLGIPYATPPIGTLRWRAPRPHRPWHGARDASTFGSPCPQFATPSAPIGDEDCLTLNIWGPATRRMPAPVMVYIHGGGFDTGDGSDPITNGAALAEMGVVLVTFNYRLGQLGFLAHPALIAEDPVHGSAGNYGFLDQQLALRWLQENIAAFGGDPDDVTIFGESAGAISVCGHLVAPSSAGLFRSAIQESGACSIAMPLRDTPGVPFESAVSLGRTFAAASGCDTASDVADCLRAKSVSEVIATAPRTLADLSSIAAHYMPNIDGSLFPTNPAELLRSGRLNATRWLGGANHDEGIGFALIRTQFLPINTQADYESALGSVLPGHAADLAALYPPAVFGSFFAAYAFFWDDVYTCTMRGQAQVMAGRGASPYLYQFSRVNAFGAQNGIGAFHGTEIPYVFGNFVSPFTEDATDAKISQFMMGAWTRFGRRGNPNRASQPEWSPYQAALDDFMQVADTVSLQFGLNAQRCDILEAMENDLLQQEVLALEK